MIVTAAIWYGSPDVLRFEKVNEPTRMIHEVIGEKFTFSKRCAYSI